jgi:class 3 adenylate cyclase
LVTERVERRLTAILAADVAGYSRLMGVDEEGTLSDGRARLCPQALGNFEREQRKLITPPRVH